MTEQKTFSDTFHIYEHMERKYIFLLILRTLVVGGVGSVGLTFISTFEHLNGFWTILSGARAGLGLGLGLGWG